jgi:hypothetical protein
VICYLGIKTSVTLVIAKTSLADQAIILGMVANPNPSDLVAGDLGQGTVMVAHPH